MRPNRFNSRIFSFAKKTDSYISSLVSSGVKIIPTPISKPNPIPPIPPNPIINYNLYIFDY